MSTTREIICEAASAGLTPELAANMLLEPSRWKERLFDPTRDLSTIYKQYLRGEIGVGVLSDAVQAVLVASNDMADLSDTVVQRYGTDATPGDIPEHAAEDANVEDQKVEVLLPTDGDDTYVKQILDSIRSKWSYDLLDRFYATPLEEAGLFAGGITADDLRSFEQGRFFNNAAESAQKTGEMIHSVGDLFQQKKWAELSDLYSEGGPLDTETAGLAGDIMVLRDVATAAIQAGYGDYPVGGVSSFEPQLQRTGAVERWVPALLNQDYTKAVSQFYKVLSSASSGGITYKELLDNIEPYTKAGSPIFNMSRRETKGGAFRTPFTYDQANLSKLSQAEAPAADARASVAQAAAVPPEVDELSKTQAVEPLRTARDVMQDLASDGEELPEPPSSDLVGATAAAQPPAAVAQPAPAAAPPLPEQPSPATTAAVSQAAAGEEPTLDDIFGDDTATMPGAVPDAQRFKKLLVLKPQRAEQLANFIKAKNLQPGIVAREIEDAYKALAELDKITGRNQIDLFMRRYEDKMPIIAKEIGKELKTILGRGETPQSGPLMAAGLKAQKS